MARTISLRTFPTWLAQTDNFVNPIVAGNGGGVEASGPPLHGFAASAAITIPANGMVVFGRG